MRTETTQLQILHKAIAINRAQYCQKERHINQWNRTKSLEIDQLKEGNWPFWRNKDWKVVEKELLFQQMVLEQLDFPMQKTKIDIDLNLSQKLTQNGS